MNNFRIAFTCIALAFICSCNKENPNNFILKGSIKNLKKGVLYLQEEKDSSLVSIDSLEIIGQPEFTLSTNLTEPKMLYLKLQKNDGQHHILPIFAAQGITQVQTTLKNFSFDAKVKGSRQHQLFEAFSNMAKKFNNQNLDLIEAALKAQQNNNAKALDSINALSDKLFKRQYSFAIQYAMNNTDSEVAPYLALYEMPDANPVFIDSIYSNLTPKIKSSFYGKQLAKVIAANAKK